MLYEVITQNNDYNGLMYGAGHGGIEAVILLSVTMIINVIFSLQTNAGVSSAFGGLDSAQALINTPFWMMLVGAVERISAVAIHVSLSVLVWFAAKNNAKVWLYPLAIASAVCMLAWEQGLARYAEPDDIREYVRTCMYHPDYRPYVAA